MPVSASSHFLTSTPLERPEHRTSVLLIHDDPVAIPQQIRSAFPAPAHEIVIAATGRAGVEAMRRVRPRVVLLGGALPDRAGLEIHDQLRAIDPGTPVIFVTSAATAATVIEAMKRGAYDYLCEPIDTVQLRRVVGHALEVTRSREPGAAPAPPPEGAVLGGSAAMLEIYKTIGRVAAQDVPVLITGESGTGKELVARAIYEHSARAGGPFLALNCAAIPDNLIESELFGYEKGAFTGADRRRIGRFEQCDGGTLLLDEIGEMPRALQAKLLRLLQEQRFERVGGSETIQTDVRIIAATNRDLRARAAHDRFRPDLYYRLGVCTIHVPPLRERREDLPALVQHYVRRFAADMARDVREVAPDALDRLVAYPWPGNVRELQSVLRQALLNASGPVLHARFLPELSAPVAAVRAVATAAREPTRFDLQQFIVERIGTSDDLHGETHGTVDRLLIACALERTNGNHRDAAKLLGISRQTLRTRMRSLGMYVACSIGSTAGWPGAALASARPA